MAGLKKIIGSIGVFIVVLANGAAIAADDSFLEECVWDRCKFRENRVMGTYCNNEKKEIFGYDWTQIDLGRCVGNNNGKLIVTENGEFYKSCEGCKLTNEFDDGTQFLACECWGTDGEKHKSKVDLAKVLYNRGGKLGCFKHLGSKFDRPPPYWNEDN